MPLPVYIIHFRAPDWVRAATASVLRSDIHVSVTVIDNSAVSPELDDRVRIIRNATNLGYAGGANVAIGDWLSGSEPFCVVASHDIDLDTDCLRVLVESAEEHPELGILGPNVEPGGCGRLLGSVADDVELRTWVTGTLMLLRRECIERIGTFDERYGSYVEDKDLGLRANDHGWKVARVTSTTVRGQGSGTEDARARIRANTVRLIRKRQGFAPALVAWLRIVWWLTRHTALTIVPNGQRKVHQSALGPYVRAVRRGARHLFASQRHDGMAHQ